MTRTRRSGQASLIDFAARMAEASLTGMRAVRPSGPKYFLIALALAVLAAVLWWVWIKPAGPIGAEDDPGKVLVIGDELAARAGQTVGDLGFAVTSMALAQAETKAAEAGIDAKGVEAALRWADHEGIGYVAFADPHGIDFSGIAIADGSAVIEEHHRFAVLSTGELGMPHHVTVGATAEMFIDVPAWVELMRALFEQERPASTLFPASQLPANAIALHDQLEAAIALQAAYNAMETKAKRLARERRERLVDAESAEPKPTILAAALDETRALPLADGGLLLFVRPRVVEGEHDPSVALVQLPSRQIWYHPPGKWTLHDRVRCDALRGGVLPDTRGHYVVDPTGRVIAFDVGDAWDVWVLEDKPGSCAFSRAGSIPQRASDEGTEAFAPDGRVARSVHDGRQLVALRVHAPGGESKTLELPGCTEASTPVWIDARRIALTCGFDPEALREDDVDDDEAGDDVLEEYVADAYDDDRELEGDDDAIPPRRGDLTERPDDAPPGVGELPPAQIWIYLVDTETPTIAALPIFELDAESSPPDPRLVRDAPSLTLLLRQARALVGRVTITANAEALLAAPPADPNAPRPPFVLTDPALPVVALAPETVTFDRLAIDLSGFAYDVSPDGRTVARELSPETHVDPHGFDIAIMDLDATAKTRVVASSDRAGHVDPFFTADGQWIVFASRYPVDMSGGLEVAAQIVAVPK